MVARVSSSHRSRKRLTDHRLSRSPLIQVAIGIFFVLSLYLPVKWYRRRFVSENRGEASGTNVDMKLVAPPHLVSHQYENRRRTLYFLPGRENRCSYRYDYVCKFWFYIRCYIYAAFPNAQMLSLGAAAVSEFKERARDDDVAVVIWRSKDHDAIPDGLADLLQWREGTLREDVRAPRVRIGVFHIANEVNRTYWPWYSAPDFVIRNYWIPDIPKHVTYVPLGPQLPNICTPRSTSRPWSPAPPEATCSCNGLGYRRSSTRKYLWNFSGSLRKKRAELLKRLRKHPLLKDRGYVQVAKKFGGDGVFGSTVNNPKNSYLESILESQFVFAPCGNAMETHRIYEALSLGAIPVIENCSPEVSHFFPYEELLIEGGTEEMVRFVESYKDKSEKIDDLQRRVTTWWISYAEEVGRNVSSTINRHVPPAWRSTP